MAQSFEELKALLEKDEDEPITVLPNGELCKPGQEPKDLGGLKPLTFREDLGGEYATA